MEEEEVVAQQTGADVAEIGEGYATADFGIGGVDVVHAAVCMIRVRDTHVIGLMHLWCRAI